MGVISREKIALLHVGKKQLGWSEEVYREALRFHGGVESSKDLDEEGFKKVVDHMKALGFWIKRKFEQSRPRDAGDLPTPGQLEVIEHLWEDLAQYVQGAHFARFRRGFYEKRCGIRSQVLGVSQNSGPKTQNPTPKISPLGPQTRAQANHVIEVLKKRVAREMKLAVERGPLTLPSPSRGEG